jgi:hypothetical protein
MVLRAWVRGAILGRVDMRWVDPLYWLDCRAILQTGIRRAASTPSSAFTIQIEADVVSEYSEGSEESETPSEAGLTIVVATSSATGRRGCV